MTNPGDKILMGILSLGYLAFSVLLFITALGWTNPILNIHDYLLNPATKWLVGSTGVLVFFISLSIVIRSFRSKRERVSAVHDTSLGQIRISLPALENLILRSAKKIEGIREVKPILHNSQGNLAIKLRVQIAPDIKIPEVSEELQKVVKDYLKRTAGINVQEIKVLVNKVSWDTKSRVE